MSKNFFDINDVCGGKFCNSVKISYILAHFDISELDSPICLDLAIAIIKLHIGVLPHSQVQTMWKKLMALIPTVI